MNRISTDKEMRVFHAKMIAGMYESIDEFAERIAEHHSHDLDEYHKAFRNLSRQLKVWQDGILESHRELFHDLYKGDDSE